MAKLLPRRGRLIRVAGRQVGTVERPVGSNSGLKVRQYQAATTLGGTGWPWCCAFVRWCMDHAGVKTVAYRGAYVPHLELWARKARKWTTAPRPGLLAVMDTAGVGYATHVEIVVKVRKSRRQNVHVGGNTSRGVAGSQDDGDGVFRRDRAWALIRGYVLT